MLILNRDVENKELEEAMQNWNKENTMEAQDMLFRKFVEADLLIPVTLKKEPSKNENGELYLEDNTDFEFPLIKAKDEKVFFPAFTSVEEFKKYAKDSDTYTIKGSFKDYVYLLDNQRNPGIRGVVMNPFNESITIFRELLLAIKERKDVLDKGHTEKTFAQGIKLAIEDPKNYPHDLVNAMCAYMRGESAIKAGYLRVMIAPDNITYLVVVDHNGNEQEIFDKIANCAKPHLNGLMLDLIHLNTELGEKATTNTEAFYQIKEESDVKA